jgi:hypothetical protein
VPALLQGRPSWAGLAAALATLLIIGPAHSSQQKPVIVHEWGTFTSLQDENGHAIGGINVDDEPVPFFVWQYVNRMVVGQYSPDSGNFGLPPYNADGGKGWTPCDPDVTLRLETPVIYIYPPKGEAPQSVPPLDVHVDFHGGVLSQFYPYARTNGSDLNDDIPYLKDPKVTGSMTTGLTWTGVRLGIDGKPFPARNASEKDAPWLRGAVVETSDPVWTTPRETSASLLGVRFSLKDSGTPRKTIAYAEAEHFLFYRGVGHLDSPLYLDCDPFNGGVKNQLSVCASLVDHGTGRPTSTGIIALDATYPAGWLVEIEADGACAFRAIPSFEEGSTSRIHPFTQFPSRFSPADFSSANLDTLKASMQAELVTQGLYPDEASAMLRTWELSYFKSPGLRFFYIVPREWIDRVLPLTVTGAPAKITRVMVGRIELISNAQKAALARLAAGPCPDLAAVKQSASAALASGKYSKDEADAFYRGDRPLRDLGIAIPPLVQDYLDLGRFRDVLILREQKLNPSPVLAEFIKRNSLGGLISQDATGSALPVAAANR